MAIKDKYAEKNHTKNRQKVVFQAKKSRHTVKKQGIKEGDGKRRQRNVFGAKEHNQKDHKTDRENQWAEHKRDSSRAKDTFAAFKAEKNGICVTEHTSNPRNIHDWIDGNGMGVMKADDAGGKKERESRFDHISEQSEDRGFSTIDTPRIGKASVFASLITHVLMKEELRNDNSTVDATQKVRDHNAKKDSGNHRIKGKNNSFGKNETVLKS